ncbi:MAG TPA: hypothetical protein VGU25_00785 [Acidobacteriaceae bacterium]|nr:hypothetical protein [Acidobacteriaceae bacterium]
MTRTAVPGKLVRWGGKRHEWARHFPERTKTAAIMLREARSAKPNNPDAAGIPTAA